MIASDGKKRETDCFSTEDLLRQISDVFEVERSVVTKHIGNIFKDKELDKKSVCANFAHTAEDGKTYQVQYNFFRISKHNLFEEY